MVYGFLHKNRKRNRMSFPIIREIWAKERCTNESFSVFRMY
ncbi:hypothetical protein BACCOPRO_01892 [Phocaeicola coprophilus DSM 18228 = JCM 13818]|uniref:Uncharacterized protein n=1 Tax=Phocaeicola coprophilus DSM 18228 = JCM 13818 TaxID=547042 RepID=S0F9F6_9BACT|nr:hypothetical protein BACCOPRO_01892 [Phocaeicola coprophilus DSM 18228 = JCM 13818]